MIFLQSYIVPIILINRNIFIWFQAFLSKTNDFKTDLYDPSNEQWQVVLHQARLNLVVMSITEHSKIHRSPEMELIHQMQFNTISNISICHRVDVLALCKVSCQRILSASDRLLYYKTKLKLISEALRRILKV